VLESPEKVTHPRLCRVASFRTYCFNRQIDGLRWTPHLEGYLHILDEQQEAPLDHLLVTLVRLKLLADEANKPLLAPMQLPEHSSLLQAFQVRSLQARIDQIKEAATVGTEYDGMYL